MERYWALQTWEDTDGSRKYSPDNDKWKFFLNDQVVAIGWKELRIKLSKDTPKDSIRQALEQGSRATNTIYNFTRLTSDSHVLLCRGYNQYSKLFDLYGYAEEIGCFYDDSDPLWGWRLKHSATVREFPEDKRKIEVEKFIGFTGPGSFTRTLQPISQKCYEKVIEWAEKEK
jgi:hypothetical protein